MRARLSLTICAALALVVIAGAQSATPTLKPFCTVGPIRCLSSLRLDLPVVQ